jgi:shikimate dehydrogenase
VISGTTRIIAHLGVPTHTFKAPLIYNPWFEAKGIDAVVVPMGCEAADFPEFLRLLFRLRNIAGALITMPHKVAATGLLDEASTAVRICGACNAVKRDDRGRLVGDMFDGLGFCHGLARQGREVRGAGVLVVGCGGAGSAIAAALANESPRRLGLFDTRIAAMEGLAANLRQHHPRVDVATGSNDPAGWDIVVNATPLGMNDGDPLPFDAGHLDRRTFVGEVVLRNGDTPLLAAARRIGCPVMVGHDMLFEQIPAYLDFFGFPAATVEELHSLAHLGG